MSLSACPPGQPTDPPPLLWLWCDTPGCGATHTGMTPAEAYEVRDLHIILNPGHRVRVSTQPEPRSTT